MEKPISEKIKEARAFMNLSQSKLAEEVGVTTRSIQAYELGEKKPRLRVLLSLARALNVSSKYLSDDECTDPSAEIEKDQHLEAAQQSFGVKGAQKFDSVRKDSIAFMAGDDITEEEKIKFIADMQKAFVDNIRKAEIKSSPKKNLPVADETAQTSDHLDSLTNTNTNRSEETQSGLDIVNDIETPQEKQPEKPLMEVVKCIPNENKEQPEKELVNPVKVWR